MRTVLLAAVALAPIAAAIASPALAQVEITNERTTPVETATANNGQPANVTITSAGSVRPAAGSTTAVTVNSNNTVTNAGQIQFNDVNNVSAVVIRGGFTGSFTNTGQITILETYNPTDADNDGDLDGPFAQGSGRYGIRLLGPGVFTGAVTHGAGGLISIEGNDSFGISVETGLTGNLLSAGSISILGDRARAISVTANVGGDIRTSGLLAVTGLGATGLLVNADVAGGLVIGNRITATGYRITTRPFLASDRARLDADDLLQGGSAVAVTGSIARGVLVDAPPADLNPNDNDEDDDGIPDASESTGVVVVQGGAPALSVGGAAGTTTTLGAVGTGDNAYGLVVRGQVTADGVYDGVASTGVRIGQAGGGAAVLQNGMHNAGTVSAQSYAADATSVRVHGGAQVPEIRNSGAIASIATGDGTMTSGAIVVEAGAGVGAIRNSGAIAAQVNGERGDAVAVVDRSGSITQVENTGRIFAQITPTDDLTDTDDPNSDPSDEVITGRTVALDLRANTSGVTIRQRGVTDGDDGADNVADPDADGDGVDDADEPEMRGDILLGSGNDTLEVLNGAVRGAMAFGDGADRLTVDGGAVASGRLTDSDGRLAVDVRNGTLEVQNAEAIGMTSLNVGADGALLVAVDGRAGTATRLNVSGAATIASGAQIGARLNTLLRTSQEFAIIQAGQLNAGAIDTGLLGQTPYLYVSSLRAEQNTGTLFLGLRRRTATEIGFNRAQGQAFEPVFQTLDRDARIERAFLNQTTREGFVALYDQLLPDHSGGALVSIAAISDAISSATQVRDDYRGRAGPNGVWAQEIFYDIHQDRDQAFGFESQGFGLAAGYEGVGTDGGALGFNVAFVAGEFEDDAAAVGEEISITFVEAGLYWRRMIGALRLDARGSLGYAGFDSDRRFVSAADNLLLQTEAEWSGLLATGHLGVSYEAGGRFYVRPQAALDAVWLRENSYEESGGGTGIDLAVDERTGNLLTGSAGLAFGARFGREIWWGPEAYLGWRQVVAGDAGTTTARFRSGGDPFTLDPSELDTGGLQIRIAMRAGGPRGFLSFETGGEFRDGQQRYDIRIVARMMF